jgi:hypothetical protein
VELVDRQKRERTKICERGEHPFAQRGTRTTALCSLPEETSDDDLA